MNLLGMSFGMGAQDVGMEAALGSAEKNLSEINDLLDEQNDKGKKSSAVWGKIKRGVDSFNIASIASNMRDLTGETGRLTNGIEAMGVANAQAAKPIIAQLNLSAKAARKMTGQVSGMAIGLNVGATEVAETVKAIHTAGGPAAKALDAMAMSQKDWVKVVTTTGVPMQDYVGMLGDMVASWGASPKQAAKMLDNLMEIGKQANIGTAAIKGAKQQLDSLDQIFEQLPPSMARTADEIQGLMESTYKLAGAFKEMGETEEQATQLGQDTAKMFAEQAVLIDKLYSMGGEGDLMDSPLFKFLTQLGIGTDEARDIISEGSRDVVSGVARINDIFRKFGGAASDQVQYALSGLSQAMGQSAAGLGFLAQSTDVGTKALSAMNSMVVKGEGALKKYGRQAHSSGRTMQEAFDLAKESFETQVRSIARSKVSNLVKRQIKAYRSVGKELKALGSDETWGPIMHAVSIFDQMGPRGVFLALSDQLGMSTDDAIKAGIKFEYAFDRVKQFGAELAPVMEILGMFGPLGPLAAAGGIAAFFIMDESDRKKILGEFYPIFESLKEKIGAVWDETLKGPVTEYWNKFTDSIAPTIAEYVYKGLKAAFGMVVDEVGTGRIAIGAGILLGLKASGFVPGLGGLLIAAGSVFTGWLVSEISNEFKKTEEALKKLKAAKRTSAEKTQLMGMEDVQKRRILFSRMSKEELAYAAQQDLLPAGVEEAFTRREKNFAAMIKSSEKLQQSLAKVIGLRTGVDPDKVMEGQDLHVYAEQLSRFQALPDVQRRLGEAMKTSTAELSRTIDTIIEAYGGRNIDEALKLVGEFEAQRSVFDEAMDFGQTGFMTEETKAAMATKLSDVLQEISSATGQVMADGGANTMSEFARGAEESASDLYSRVGGVLEGSVASQIRGHSPPVEGPLSNDAAFSGAVGMMENFADGIYSSSELVREAVEQTLNDSVILTIESYQEKMEELGRKKSILRSIAHQMVRDFGGTVKMGSVQVDDVKTNAQATLEAALNVPGMGGVIAAVVSTGHQTNKILSKIYDETKRTADYLSRNDGGNAPPGAPILPS